MNFRIFKFEQNLQEYLNMKIERSLIDVNILILFDVNFNICLTNMIDDLYPTFNDNVNVNFI